MNAIFKTLTVGEVMAINNLSDRTVKDNCVSEKYKARKAGRVWLIDKLSVYSAFVRSYLPFEEHEIIVAGDTNAQYLSIDDYTNMVLNEIIESNDDEYFVYKNSMKLISMDAFESFVENDSIAIYIEEFDLERKFKVDFDGESYLLNRSEIKAKFEFLLDDEFNWEDKILYVSNELTEQVHTIKNSDELEMFVIHYRKEY